MKFEIRLHMMSLLLGVLLINCAVPIFAQGTLHQELISVYIGGKYGFIDASGKIIIQPKYEDVGSFNTQCECVSVKNDNNLWGIMNVKGQWIVPPRFTFIGVISDGFVPVKENGENKFKYIDMFGNVLVEGFDFAKAFSNGMAAVNIENKWGYINTKGMLVIPPKYHLDGIFNLKSPSSFFHSAVGDFSEGLAEVILNRKRFYIRPDDTVAIVLVEGTVGGDFSEGLAVIWKNEKYGIIDVNGQTILKPTFHQIEQFSEGLAPFRNGVLWGYLNKEGKLAINDTFEFAKEFSCGLAAVKSKGKWGYIDKTGKFLIDPKYDNAESFRNRLANVELNEREFYINAKGEIVFQIPSK